MNKKAFTLLELLVVVLIIGILAGIALPQYRLAVGKAQYSTLKTITRNLQDAVQRYYLIHGSYEGVNNQGLDIEIPGSVYCHVFEDALNDRIYCVKMISGESIEYTINRSNGLPFGCRAAGNDRNSIRDRICKNDTGDNTGSSSNNGWWYHYKRN